MRKRARYLKRCKDALWLRWTGEYLRALRERHVMKNNKSEVKLKAGDVVLIKGEERNHGKWNIGIVEEIIKGRDGKVRVVKLRAGKSHLERPIQHLYLLELEHEEEKKAGMLSWMLVLPNSDQDGILHKKQKTNWLES